MLLWRVESVRVHTRKSHTIEIEPREEFAKDQNRTPERPRPPPDRPRFGETAGSANVSATRSRSRCLERPKSAGVRRVGTRKQE
jgi:hypothetical protein